MEIIYFIYGLSFFIFGTLVLFARTEDSDLFFADKLWFLGIFAILHAIVEWLILYQNIHPEVKNILIPIEVAFLLFSYLFLFEFSRFILRKSFEDPNSKYHFIYHLYSAPIIYAIGTVLLLTQILLFPGLNETIIAIRYTYGFWGSLFLGIGLYFYSNSLKDVSHIKELKFNFKIAGIAFLAYSFFAGIIVPEASHFPANIINDTWFVETFHIPVQVFRSICAAIIAISSIKALKIFRNELTEKLNQSYQQIKEFSSNASHQLKTPLSSMKVQIDVTLEKERTISEYKEVLNSVNQEVNSLESLVSNLLILTRMRDKSIKDAFDDILLDDILLDVISEYMIIADKKKINLEIEDLEEMQVLGNKTLLSILLTNLIDNAIKYTGEGKTITISIKNDILQIRDEGIGIEKENINRIFDKFYQNNTKDIAKKGYGLGLAMVKRIAKIHDGIIHVESIIKKGTCISIRFKRQ